MLKLTLAALLLALAACTTKAPTPASAYRQAGAPMWSNAQFDLSRLPGRWQQAASFVEDSIACKAGGAEFSGKPGSLRLASRLCLGGQESRLSGPVTVTGPGRLNIGGAEWWVIWVDTDYRTMAIATPSGAYGFILNRGGALPRDRLNAAREIFAFNGYDTARLTAY